MRRRLFKNLVSRPCTEAVSERAAAFEAAGATLRGAIAQRLGRSLAIREVDAGSCNGCELEIHALGNAFYDIERFGVRFVASPRHADLLLVTGPAIRAMDIAVAKTYTAIAEPKIVVAVGACALGGVYPTDEYVHEHPWKAVGIAAGVGFVLGLLIGRR